jgi:RimJ/RimL family protein N-acetyltransferase/heme-degrading monooxygenase HmoA
MTIAVIYRWRVKPGLEEQFASGWSEGTAAVHERCASFGARLHRPAKGGELWVSYARWPDEASRKACFATNDFHEAGFAKMREAVAETLPQIVMEIVDDQLDEPPFWGAVLPALPRRALDAGGGLTLRPLDPDRDAEALHASLGDAGSSAFLPSAATASVAATRRKLARSETPATPQWVIVRDDGPALGRVTLMSRRLGVAELGIQVVPSAQRTGLARRAVCAITDYGLDELGLVRVAADVDPENEASRRLFERAGFTLEGRQKDAWVTHTGVADSLIYAATRGWKAPG